MSRTFLRRLAGRFVALVFAAVLASAAPPTLAAERIEGTTGEGARYAFDLPDRWNGDLVVYAHGIVDPGLPVALPSAQDGFHLLRDAWLDLGYAVASSSYSENGYAVKDGAQRTHQLVGLFADAVGRPGRVYLAGHSLGGVIGQMLIEAHPARYDGALLICAFLGGAPLEVTYLTDARVLFDYFFPGVLPGDALHIPEDLDFFPGSPTFTRVLMALTAGFAAPGVPTIQFARAARLPASGANEIVLSALTAIGFGIRFGGDVAARAHDRSFYDNTATVYSGSFDDAALNAGVDRFTSSPDAVNYYEKYYTPAGDLRRPVVTLHTTLDPVAPAFHEEVYAGVVAAAGAADLLVQRRVARYGHCAATLEETLAAFRDLRDWVETGLPPAGEPLPEPQP